MGILSRFADIVSANINALLDKAEDPEKMIDEYLRRAMEDLAEVKQETAAVMAEESRCKRLYEQNQAEVQKYMDLAKKALAAGNEGDARVFLSKKQELEANAASLEKTYQAARANADKMRQMHDKLTEDINTLKARRQNVKATMAVATRLAPGIAEAIRAASLAITPRAMLSRAVSVIRGKTLIVNLPGSPKAVCESMDVFLPQMPHALGLLRGEVRDCAR